LDAEHPGAAGSVVVVVVVVVVGGAGVAIHSTTLFFGKVDLVEDGLELLVQEARVSTRTTTPITPSLRTAVLEQPY
jgi:hypothetical protein